MTVECSNRPRRLRPGRWGEGVQPPPPLTPRTGVVMPYKPKSGAQRRKERAAKGLPKFTAAEAAARRARDKRRGVTRIHLNGVTPRRLSRARRAAASAAVNFG